MYFSVLDNDLSTANCAGKKKKRSLMLEDDKEIIRLV